MQKGIRINQKPKAAPEPKGPDFSTTSKARQTLAYARKNMTPEKASEVEQQVSEKYPDILTSRRRV